MIDFEPYGVPTFDASAGSKQAAASRGRRHPFAIGLRAQANIGFRDAMIVQAASESGCDVLWTEDLNDGQVLRGVRIRNPFTDADE